MKMTKIFAVVLLLEGLLFQSEAFTQTTMNRIDWSSFNMGFAIPASASTMVKSVAGQAFVGTMQQSNTRIESGFLAYPWFLIIDGVSEREEGEEIPTQYDLQQNYPNPFNPSTTIAFSLPKPSGVTLKIFDASGREVATLVEGKLPAGKHEVVLDASPFSSGVYFYRLQANEFSQTRRLILMK